MGPAFSNWFLTKSCVRLSHSKGHLYLNLPASRTDPFREGIMLTIAARNDNGCPVRAMTQFLAIDTHRPPNAPLFCVGRENQYPFTREYVIRILQERATRASLLQGSWNGHSFRRGAATWAAATSPTASPSGMTGALEGKEVMVGFFPLAFFLGFFLTFLFSLQVSYI